MRPDARPAPRPVDADGDVDDDRRRRAHLPRLTGGSIAQHRAVTAGEDSRPPASEGADDPMPYGVHARVEPEQPSRRQSAFDLARGDAAGEKLPARDDPALTLGECGDDAVRGALSTHVVEEAPRAADSPL